MNDKIKATETKRRQLIIAYKEVFTSEKGQIILADLKARYGWGADGVELPSFRPALGADQQAYAEGMKEPVRQILRWLAAPIDAQQKPQSAISHERTE